MSKTKKKLFYSAIVAAVILLAFVAVTFMTAPHGSSVISETGEGQSVLNAAKVTQSDGTYGSIDVVTEYGGPGTVTQYVTDATPIYDDSGLDSALKSNSGTYYLEGDIEYTASTESSSAATSGTFGGVLYGNGHTITVTVESDTFTSSDFGNYGFLVKTLSNGTIRDLNVVIKARDNGSVIFGKKSGNNADRAFYFGSDLYLSNEYFTQIGGIAGNMTSGTIENCTVKYSGNIKFAYCGSISGSNVHSGKNVSNVFGGAVGTMSGGTISYTTVNFADSCQIINAGQQPNSDKHMYVVTGGIVGIAGGNGSNSCNVTLNKVSVQGNGILAGEAQVYGSGIFTYNDTDVFTGALIGYSTGLCTTSIKGVYLNLTSNNVTSNVFGQTMSEGATGAIKGYIDAEGGINDKSYTTKYDSIKNDDGKNYSTDSSSAELRTTYGIGAVETTGITNVSIQNVYVSATMDSIIKAHHPYAINDVQCMSNSVWSRYNWTYTVIDPSLGTDLIFISGDKEGVYFAVNQQMTTNFVYTITQSKDNLSEIYEIYSKTYDKNGKVFVPAMYVGYASDILVEVKRDGVNKNGNDTTAATPYISTVSAETGSYLYMDFDMSKVYDGTDRYADGYQGSGNNYTYTYNGNMLYVPSFAGYTSANGTGTKVNLTEDELNSLLGGSNAFLLTSSYTISNPSESSYEIVSPYWFRWNGSGNVGSYSISVNLQNSSDSVFITKDGNNYYCSLKESYPSKSVTVEPCQIDINWSAADFVYDGTGKDLTATFRGLPAGNELGNNDYSMLGVAVAYSASNENLLVQNKPYHAGEYTATATLTYNGTTENQLTGNFTLASSVYSFEVGKAQISVQPENVVSLYGNDHAALLAGAKVTVSGKWIGDDQSSFVFTAKTVNDTINWATTKGEYDTTVGVALAEGAAEELLGDYEFNVTQGTLTVNERPINGTLTINGGVYNGGEYSAALTLDEDVRVGSDSVFTLGYLLNGEETVTAVNAGEYVIRITPEADKYAIGTIVIEGKDELYVDGETKLVVDQRSVNVTLSFDNGYVYDGANKVTGYAVQEQDGDAGVLSGEDAGLVMSYNGEAEAILPASYTAVATFSNGNYKAGTIAGGTFTVERADLSEIRIDQNSATYDGKEKSIGYTLVGVANEANIASLAGAVTVTYNRSTSLPVNADIYEVEINVAEGVAYNAKSASTTFTVNKADITFLPVAETTYTGKNIEPEYSVSAPGMDDASSLKNFVTVSSTVILNASTYDVTLAFAGTGNYNAKTEKYSLTVKRADLAVDIADGQTLTYNASAQIPAYTVSALVDGDAYGAVTLTVTGDNATNGQAVNAGTYSFTISIAQSVNYNAVEKTVSFTIGKYELSLIGATEQFVTVLKDGGGEMTAIDSYLPYVDVALIDGTGVYDETDLLFMTNPADELIFADGKATFTAEITVDGLNTENYAFTPVTITVNVLDASITITVNGHEETLTAVTFGDELAIEAKGSYGGNAEEAVQKTTWYAKGESGDYDVELGAQPTDAGDYMAVFKYTFNTDNYVTRALYLTISPKAVTVTLDGSAISVTYGDEMQQNVFDGATYKTDAGNLDLTVEYSTNAVRFSPVGNYTLGGVVTAVTDGNVGNYVFNVVPGSLKVVKKTVYVKAADVTATYGDEVIFSDYTVYTDDGVNVWADYENAAQLKVTFSVQSGILTVGKYDVTVTGENANYNVYATSSNGTLTVEKRNITITVSDVNVTYGAQELPAVTGSITGGNLVNGDTLGTIAATWNNAAALSTLDATSYALSDYATLSATLNSAQEGTNYEITFETSTKLTVSPKNVTITFVGWQSADGMVSVDNAVTYNAGAWSPSATVDGIVNDDVVEIAIDDGTEIKNAGTYSRKLSLSGADAGNYVAEVYVATLEVLPYKTEITVDQTVYEYTYGDAKTAISPSIRVLDGDVDDGSFVQKNYVGDNTGVTGTQVGWDEVWNAGSYTVAISYAGGNYTADTVYITVTVDKKMLNKVDAINDGDLGYSEYNASNVNITADMVADLTSFAGLEDYINVVYKVDGNVVTVVRNAGVYTVDLVLMQNDNYAINGGGDSLLKAPATYTVNKAQAENLNFSLTYANKVYNGEDMSDYIRSVIAVSGINGEPVTGASLELSGSDGTILDPVNSDVYAVYAQATGMTNYEDMSASVYVGDFTIDKVYVAIETIGLPGATYTYDSFEKSISGTGIQQSAVLKKVIYEYVKDDYTSGSGATTVGTYNVKMTVLLDKDNSRFGSDVTLETVVDAEVGECYKYELNAVMTIEKAVPTVTIDINSRAAYFDGNDHAISFAISGVGNDAAMNASYDKSVGVQSVTIDGLGTFTVSYYKDSAYNELLTDGSGAAALPITVLLSNGKTLPYYLMINFTSSNPNYADKEYRNSGSNMELYIMQSIVTLSFNSLSVPYGTLKNRSAANDYVNANMKYSYTVNDEGSASVNYDPEAMLEISYNLGSFDVNTGTYDISVEAKAAKTEFADSVTAVVSNASAIKLNITAADVTDEMKAAFTDVSDFYGNKTYTATALGWDVKGILSEDVAYAVSYNGDPDFSISDAGEYKLTVSVPEGNYKAWSDTVMLKIAQVGLDVVWTMDGAEPVDGVFTKTYDGQPANVTASVVGAEGVTATVVYVNSEGAEIDAPYVVGTHSAKAVLSDSNYYVNEDCGSVTVVIEAIVLDEDAIKGWISDDSDEYGSVQGIDITGLPEGFGAVSIEYRAGDVVYDMTTVRNATVGEYSATVTVSNGSSTGSATFTYTVTKREIVFTVSVSGTAGTKPTVSNVTLVSDKALASGDTAKVTGITFNSAYSQDMSFGVYKLSDYVSAVEIAFNAHGDCYDYRIETGDLRLVPAGAPVVADTVVNHNTVTLTFAEEAVYAYRIGSRGTWVETSNASDTVIVSGLNANTTYSIYVAYAGFTSVNSFKSVTTTSDPDTILTMIDEIMEGGLTIDKQAQYESILAFYEGIAESDRAEIQAEYDALVSQFEALKNGGSETPGDEGDGSRAAVIAVSVICGLLVLGAIAGVIAAVVVKKRKKNSVEV